MNHCLHDVIPMLVLWQMLISRSCVLVSSAKSPANGLNSNGLMSALGSDICNVVQGKVEQLEAMVERTTSELSQMMTRFREVEGKHIGSEEALATLGRAVDTHLVSTHMLPLSALCLVPACVLITM